MLNPRENRMISLTFYPPMRSQHVTCEAKHVLAEYAGHDPETRRIKENSIDIWTIFHHERLLKHRSFKDSNVCLPFLVLPS